MRLHDPLRLLLTSSIGILLSSVLVLDARPAAAEPYPAVPPQITTSTEAVSDGGTVTFTGTGFLPFELIEIDIAYGPALAAARLTTPTGPARPVHFMAAHIAPLAVVVKTLNADANGNFTTNVTLTEPGTAIVTASGTVSLVQAVATVTILTSSPTTAPRGARRPAMARSRLATTGDSWHVLAFEVGGGTAALTVGSALIWLTRRRRRAES